MADFVVGIDLGTTNSSLAFADSSGDSRPQSFQIPQLVSEGEVAGRATLPSALYLAGEHDVAAEAVVLPWASPQEEVVGTLATALGTRQAGRLVTSAKSWLCHGGVDRESAILPWGADAEVRKRSPVEVSSRFLAHMKAGWDARHPDSPLSRQDVVLAVPASFDEVARELTVQAASLAGLERVRLLEEPQAALYAWTATHENWRSLLEGISLILVVDVGGGTTDFSLVAVRTTATGRGLERTFVGNHLLVGGDNMDLALAHAIVGDRRSGLDAPRWQQLTLQTRLAKERILDANDPADSVEIAVAGGGRRLLGNTLRGSLAGSLAEKTLLEGFFPLVEADARPLETEAGLQEFGLPFAADPAISRHLAAFLGRASAALGTGVVPDAVLFNGGALKPEPIRKRLCEQLLRWTGRSPVELADADHDLAVARGAVAYGKALRGSGNRISGGSARSYFLGVAGREPPTMVCLASRGMQEGEEVELSEPLLELATNQHVQFPLFVSTTRMGDTPGALYPRDSDSVTALPPLGSRLQFGKSLESRPVPVSLRALLTETGTLEVWCESRETTHRWKLSFDLRTQATSETWAPEGGEESSGAETVFAPEALAKAETVLAQAFVGDADPVRVMARLEDVLGLSRSGWPMPALRHLWDVLLAHESFRRRSPEHESRWLNLCGYLLRPGYGELGDDLRSEKVWRLFNEGLYFPKSSQCGAEWWVLWKRVAGGLSRPQQTALLQELRPVLLPGNRRRKNRKRSAAQQFREMWQVAGSLERVGVGPKGEVFDGLLGKTADLQSLSDAEVWALGRMGARELVYGPADTVLPPARVAEVLRAFLNCPGDLSPSQALAVAQMARRSGDRARDLEEDLREACAQRLSGNENTRELAAIVRTVQPASPELRARIVADSLPTGLRIVLDDNP